MGTNEERGWRPRGPRALARLSIRLRILAASKNVAAASAILLADGSGQSRTERRLA